MWRAAVGGVLVAAAVVAGACRQENAPGAREDSSDSGRSPGAGAGGSAGATGAAVAPAGARTVLFVGTSLTAGLGLEPDSAYPQLVAGHIEAAGLPYQVVNAGVSGETTAGLLSRLDWLLRRRAEVVVIESGANDGLRAIPVEAIERNLDSVVVRVRAANPEARVLLVQMEAPPNLGGEYTRAFRAMYARVATRHGVTLLPFLLEGVAGHQELNQPDGIHPNEEGARRVAANVWKALEPVLRAEAGRQRG